MKGGGAFYCQPYQAGEVVFHEGDIGKEMFVVVSGCVEMYRADARGRQLGSWLPCHPVKCSVKWRWSPKAGVLPRRVPWPTTPAWCASIRRASSIWSASNPAFALSVIRMMAQRLAGNGEQEAQNTVLEGA